MSDRSLLESWIERFEEAWAEGRRPLLDDFLPDQNPQRRAVLVELIHIDLENRIKIGEAARVEDYLARFPDVQGDRGTIADLVLREYELRFRSEPGLRVEEYSRRFPNDAEILHRLDTKRKQYNESPTDKTEVLSSLDTPLDSVAGNSIARARDYDFVSPATQPNELGWLGSYRLLKVLGEGGMGIVFQAEDMQLKRHVALKVMKPEVAGKPSARERFSREARVAATLEHENIAGIYQVGEERGVLFIAMPLLKGMTLEERLRQSESMTISEIINVGRQVALGLAAAHARGLIHRDIKPANIWLESDGRVKILDFGLAHAADQDVSLTEFGLILGTPAYLAPEQARGEDVDRRADLFSLGVVLYRMCTRQLPFSGETPLAVLSALLTTAPLPVLKLNKAVPPALGELVEQLLSADPPNRPKSAEEVVERLRQVRGRTLSQRSRRKFVEKRRRMIMLALAAVFVLAMGYSFRGSVMRPVSDSGPVTEMGSEQTCDREVAQWVVRACGGSITVRRDNEEIDVRGNGPLPSEPFKLVKINLDGTPVTDADIWHLEGLTNLEDLHLFDAKVGDAGLSHIQNLRSLKMLWVGRAGQVTNQGMFYLKDLTNLEYLHAWGLGLDDRGLSYLQHLVNLQYLSYGTLTDEGLGLLPGFKKLTSLGFTGKNVSEQGLGHLGELTALKELGLGGLNVKNEGLARLRTLTDLSTLVIEGTAWEGEGVSQLKALPNLRFLGFVDTHVGDHALEQLKGIQKLFHLNLNRTAVTDAGMVHLTAFPDLSELYLNETKLTDAGLVHIGKISSLTKLILADTQVTDVGIQQLKDLTQLQTLDIGRTRVSGAGASQLRKALPKCEIILVR